MRGTHTEESSLNIICQTVTGLISSLCFSIIFFSSLSSSFSSPFPSSFCTNLETQGNPPPQIKQKKQKKIKVQLVNLKHGHTSALHLFIVLHIDRLSASDIRLHGTHQLSVADRGGRAGL